MMWYRVTKTYLETRIEVHRVDAFTREEAVEESSYTNASESYIVESDLVGTDVREEEKSS